MAMQRGFGRTAAGMLGMHTHTPTHGMSWRCLPACISSSLLPEARYQGTLVQRLRAVKPSWGFSMSRYPVACGDKGYPAGGPAASLLLGGNLQLGLLCQGNRMPGAQLQPSWGPRRLRS